MARTRPGLHNPRRLKTVKEQAPFFTDVPGKWVLLKHNAVFLTAPVASESESEPRAATAAAVAPAADPELAELRRWKADAQALLGQTGCASLGEVASLVGGLRRAASANGASSSAAGTASASAESK